MFFINRWKWTVIRVHKHRNYTDGSTGNRKLKAFLGQYLHSYSLCKPCLTGKNEALRCWQITELDAVSQSHKIYVYCFHNFAAEKISIHWQMVINSTTCFKTIHIFAIRPPVDTCSTFLSEACCWLREDMVRKITH